MGKTRAKTEGRRRIAISAVVACALLALSALLPFAEWARGFEDSLDNHGFLAAVAIFTAVYLVATMLFAPGWVFPLAAGAAFGLLWGFLIAVAASLLSALAAFLVARYLLREAVMRRAKKHRLFAQLDRAVAKDGWKVVAMLRLTPMLPFAVKNYFLGLTRIGLAQYAMATVAGMLPGLLAKVYLGAAGRAALEPREPMQWITLAIGLAASVALTLWLGRFARGRLGSAFPKLP